MRILVIADIESKALWDYFDKSMLENVDLIVSCGDLNPKYLSFLATFTKAPVIYVRGNHDAKYEMTPPDGCICIEDDIFEFHGVRLLGLGGSMRYKEGSNMFTEKEMKKRVNKMRFKLRKKDGFDILVTHAPAYQLNDGDDIPHQGFQVFRDLMDCYKPLLFVHGHVHANYGGRYKRECKYNETRVVNAYERYYIDIDDDDIDPFLMEAIELVVKTGQVSTSFIQRKFRIAYERAGRIIDQMEEREIISGYQGSKPRAVLMSRDKLNELKSNNN